MTELSKEAKLQKDLDESTHEVDVLMKSNKALREELKLSNLARGRDAEEIAAIKSDYRKIQKTVCVECTNQEKLVKENKEMFRWLMAMAGITILTLIGWWLK